ncbi:plasminogen-binding N-terminal domain-containing protein [Arcobacter sp. s6]|uniref:plasminogen-binding N-terminal domain-containing protein n=1 Tax=Arcobacter sp. s6 TaxID=3230363 RepID=UPI0034A02909
MTKIFNKLLLLSATCLLSSNLLAQETVCFKNNVEKPSLVENVSLDGGVCNGNLSLNQMKKEGWNVLDIKITPIDNKFNYSYYLIKNDNQNIALNTSNDSKYNVNNNFSVKPMGIKIENIDDNKSTINIGNLIIGQTGIIVHIYDNDKKLIVSNAKVISSNSNSSVVEFFKFDDLKQDALPTTKRMVEKGDVLVLNYMYNSSLLITPTQDTFQTVRNNFKLNNFIHSDILAAKLKINNKPFPTKEDFQEFAIEQNLGTIFFVLNNKVYILDTKTFTILDSYALSYENSESQMPFYTRVEEIEASILDFSFSDLLFFKDKKVLSYNEYYQEILGLTK